MHHTRSRSATSRRNVNQGKSWSYDDEGVLLDNAGYESVVNIAKRLGRTPKAVSRKAERLMISTKVY